MKEQRDKDYNFEKIKDSKVKKEIENIDELLEDKKEVKFNIGDKVLLLDYKKSGIVYKEEDDFNNVTVFYNKEFIKVHISRLKLEIKATELYPEGYDLNQLFVSYKDRKLERDIERGSKKALKKIQKEIRNRC